MFNAEKVCLSLYNYMTVSNIETGFKFGDTYMIVYFSPAPGIHKIYQKAKKKARDYVERKEVLERIAVPADKLKKRKEIVELPTH